MNKTLGSLFLVLIIVASIIGAVITVNTRSLVNNSLTIVFEEDAIKALGIKGDSYSVAIASLTIPGVAVLTPSDIRETDKELIISFEGIKRYEDQIRIFYFDNPKTNNVKFLPTFYLVLADYNTGEYYYIVFSSMAKILIDYAEESGKNLLDLKDIERVKEETMRNKLALLRSGAVKLTANNIFMLKGLKLVGSKQKTSPNIRNLVKLGISDFSSSEICNGGKEYPYEGTHIYQVVNETKYYELTRSVPEWWSARYIERGDGDNYIDEYNRFVQDLLASKYLAEKAYYQDKNKLIDDLRDYIAERRINPADLPDNTITLESYIGVDEWNDTGDNIENNYEYRDIPLFRYYFNNYLSTSDAERFELEIHLHYTSVSGIISGLLFSGLMINTEHTINVTQVDLLANHIKPSNESKRLGTLWIRNALITYQPDSDTILIDWIIDETTCEDYYIITPIVTVVPVYNVAYDENSFEFEFTSDGNPYYEDWNSSSVYINTIDRIANKDLEEDSDIIWSMHVSKDSSSGQIMYNALIDTPPLFSIIVQFMLEQLDNPVANLLAKTYAVLSSIGYVQTEVSAEALYMYVEFAQIYDLSKNVLVTLDLHSTESRINLGGNEYYNMVFITLAYQEDTGSGPCYGPYCATNKHP